MSKRRDAGSPANCTINLHVPMDRAHSFHVEQDINGNPY